MPDPDPNSEVITENSDCVSWIKPREETRPQIPMPEQTRWGRLICNHIVSVDEINYSSRRCGKKSLTLQEYKEHFVYWHIYLGK